jgi:hypothetical protein
MEMTYEQKGVIAKIIETAKVYDNMNLIEDMISSPNFHGIPQDEKEKYIFSLCYSQFLDNNNNITCKLLGFIIFNCNISVDNSIEQLAALKIDIDPRVKSSFQARDLKQRVRKACYENNIEEIQEILLSDCYPLLTQEEKELYLLKTANKIYFYSEVGADIFTYLIFEYGINKGIYIPSKFHDMFLKRDLYKEIKTDLNQELKLNDTQLKRIKI